jgi:hypothetical protein
MTTAHNARVIEDQLSEAASHLSDAIEKFKNAIAAVESAENSPANKTPELESIKGLLEVGFRATSAVTRQWHNFAVTRADNEAER